MANKSLWCKDAARKNDGGYGTDRRKYEQISPVDPAMHDRKIVAKCMDEDDH